MAWYDDLSKLDRIDTRLDGTNYVDERVDAHLARIASLSGGLDPTWRTGIGFAEHQYLLNKKDFSPLTGLDTATFSALMQVPANPPTISPLGEWAQDLLGPSQPVGSVFSKIDNFLGLVGDRMSAVAVATGNILESEFMGGLKDMIGNLPKMGDFAGFWSEMAPAIEEFRVLIEDARDGEAALEAAQFGFADHLWNLFYLRTFAHVDPKVKDATVTNMLAAHTRKGEFAESLQEAVEGSRLLRKRWRVIGPALKAHQTRSYELSVPTLFMQIEGTLVDAMFMKNLVVKKNNKFYLVDKNGDFLLPPGRKRPSPVTLDPAIKHAKLDENPELAAASEFMADVLVQRRNAVLHGRDVTYGRAKLSVQALLLLMVLVAMVREMEDDDS